MSEAESTTDVRTTQNRPVDAPDLPTEVSVFADDETTAFARSYYTQFIKPQTRDVADDADWEEKVDAPTIPDESRAEQKARRIQKFLLGGSYGSEESQRVLFLIPGWYAQDTLGLPWEPCRAEKKYTALVGEYDFTWTNEEDDGSTTRKMKLDRVEPLNDRGEDEYFRNRTDDVWVNLSMVEAAWAVYTPEKGGTLIQTPEGTTSGKPSEADIHVEYVEQNGRYSNVVLDSPFESQYDIKDAADEHDAFTTFNGDNWVFQANKAEELVSYLTDAEACGDEGPWTVALSDRVRDDDRTNL